MAIKNGIFFVKGYESKHLNPLLIRLQHLKPERIANRRRCEMDKYRIVYRPVDSDPCHWQLQERKRLFFFFWRWEELYNFSSATSAGNEMLLIMNGGSQPPQRTEMSVYHRIVMFIWAQFRPKEYLVTFYAKGMMGNIYVADRYSFRVHKKIPAGSNISIECFLENYDSLVRHYKKINGVYNYKTEVKEIGLDVMQHFCHN
jgi:hypothetical protein